MIQASISETWIDSTHDLSGFLGIDSESTHGSNGFPGIDSDRLMTHNASHFSMQISSWLKRKKCLILSGLMIWLRVIPMSAVNYFDHFTAETFHSGWAYCRVLTRYRLGLRSVRRRSAFHRQIRSLPPARWRSLHSHRFGSCTDLPPGAPPSRSDGCSAPTSSTGVHIPEVYIIFRIGR